MKRKRDNKCKNNTTASKTAKKKKGKHKYEDKMIHSIQIKNLIN